MRKLLRAFPALLVLAMIGAPNARADSYTVTFTCEAAAEVGNALCPFASLPMAPDVSFPAPTAIAVTIGQTSVYNVSLPATDAPTDAYSFTFESLGSPITGNSGPEWQDAVTITDVDSNISATAINPGGPTVPYTDSIFYGSLSFSPVSAATPEPNEVILMFLGIVLIFLMRKRFDRRLPRVA